MFRTFQKACMVVVMLVCIGGCSTTYTSVSKAGGNLYLTGSTRHGANRGPWVKRCVEVEDAGLVCQRLSVRAGTVPVKHEMSSRKLDAGTR